MDEWTNMDGIMFAEVESVTDAAVQVRFRQLLAEKEVRENTRFKLTEVARQVGMSRQAVYAWLDGSVRSVPLDTLAQLCAFLDCHPGDLLVLAPVEAAEEKAEPA